MPHPFITPPPPSPPDWHRSVDGAPSVHHPLPRPATRHWTSTSKLAWAKERLGELLSNLPAELDPEQGSLGITTVKSITGEVSAATWGAFRGGVWTWGVDLLSIPGEVGAARRGRSRGHGPGLAEHHRRGGCCQGAGPGRKCTHPPTHLPACLSLTDTLVHMQASVTLRKGNKKLVLYDLTVTLSYEGQLAGSTKVVSKRGRDMVVVEGGTMLYLGQEGGVCSAWRCGGCQEGAPEKGERAASRGNLDRGSSALNQSEGPAAASAHIHTSLLSVCC